MKKKCVQCGREFDLSEGEISYYKGKGIEVPKRCYSCRKANRIKNTNVVAKRKRLIVNGKPQIGFGGNSLTGLVMILIIVVSVAFGGHFRNTGSDKNGTQENQQQSRVETTSPDDSAGTDSGERTLVFRSEALWEEHFKKHGKEVGCATKQEYLAGANAVVANRKSLHKTEREDGDDVYFLEATGELVIVSTDGYIRTYFMPGDGISYYNRQ